jgi:hypothetical protein
MKKRLSGSSMGALLACLILAQAGDTPAQEKKMYQWTDQNGVVHFSDMAPEGQDVQARDLPVDRAPTAASPYQQPDSGPSAAQQRREDIARKSEESRARKATLDAQCAAWQAEVDRLEPNRRVFYTNDQGETERMDDVARTNRVAELKAQIARNCR